MAGPGIDVSGLSDDELDELERLMSGGGGGGSAGAPGPGPAPVPSVDLSQLSDADLDAFEQSLTGGMGGGPGTATTPPQTPAGGGPAQARAAQPSAMELLWRAGKEGAQAVGQGLGAVATEAVDTMTLGGAGAIGDYLGNRPGEGFFQPTEFYEQNRRDNPWLSATGGALASGAQMLAAPVAMGARALEGAAAPALRGLTQRPAAAVAAQAGRDALATGTLSGTETAMRGGDLEQVARSAATGAAIGALPSAAAGALRGRAARRAAEVGASGEVQRARDHARRVTVATTGATGDEGRKLRKRLPRVDQPRAAVDKAPRYNIQNRMASGEEALGAGMERLGLGTGRLRIPNPKDAGRTVKIVDNRSRDLKVGQPEQYLDDASALLEALGEGYDAVESRIRSKVPSEEIVNRLLNIADELDRVPSMPDEVVSEVARLAERFGRKESYTFKELRELKTAYQNFKVPDKAKSFAGDAAKKIEAEYIDLLVERIKKLSLDESDIVVNAGSPPAKLKPGDRHPRYRSGVVQTSGRPGDMPATEVSVVGGKPNKREVEEYWRQLNRDYQVALETRDLALKGMSRRNYNRGSSLTDTIAAGAWRTVGAGIGAAAMSPFGELATALGAAGGATLAGKYGTKANQLLRKTEKNRDLVDAERALARSLGHSAGITRAPDPSRAAFTGYAADRALNPKPYTPQLTQPGTALDDFRQADERGDTSMLLPRPETDEERRKRLQREAQQQIMTDPSVRKRVMR